MTVIVLGVLINALYFVGGLYKDPRYCLITSFIAGILFIVYSCLIGLYSPIVIHATNAFISLALLFPAMWHFKKHLAIICAIIVTAYLAVFFNHALDIIIILAAWCVAFARMNVDNNVLFKSGMIVSQMLWIFYAFVFKDYAMLASCIILLFSHGSALFRIIFETRLASFRTRIFRPAPVANKTFASAPVPR